MSGTRVLVADSLDIFRVGVRNVLSREGDFEVVEAASLEDALDAVEANCPELALIDLELPALGGIVAVQRLSRRAPIHPIVWSFDPKPETVLSAVRAGAEGFLRKDISPDGLVRALRGALRGEAPLSRDLASLMIDALHGQDAKSRARDRVDLLSSREREVLDLLAQRSRNREIAAELAISEFTVKRHVQNILQKLELPSRGAAAAFHRSAFDPEEAPTVRAARTA